MILDEILGHKRAELAAARAREAPEKLARRAEETAAPLRDFVGAIARGPEPRVIAEVKRRSPSRGEIRADFDPVACALVEVHDEAELDAALASGARVIGINNRDLRTFETDLGVTERLAPRVPEGVVVVAESGIFTRTDMARLAASGAQAFLIGESLMREADMAGALRRLRRAS